MRNNKIEENEDKARVDNNKCRWLRKMLGDDEEVDQALRDMAIKDVIHKVEIENKKIEKKVETCHIDNEWFGDLDQTIKTFVDKDNKEQSASEAKIPSHTRKEDCNKLNDFSDNESQVDDCNSASCYEESDSSLHSGKSEVPTDFEE